MAGIADDLDNVVVTVTSPDGRIEGRVASLRSVSLRFLYDSYERYYRHRDAEVLAHQLGRGATLMGAAYQKARREVMLAHGFERYSVARPPYSPRHREYLERGAELTAYGSSSNDEIRVRTVGLVDFKVRIGVGVLDRCDGRAFMLLAKGAMGDLQANYKRVLTELRHELFLRYKDGGW